MRNPERLLPIYEQIAEFHKEYIPDWRIGQMMVNFIGWYYSSTGKDIFFLEDNKLLEFFEKYKEEL